MISGAIKHAEKTNPNIVARRGEFRHSVALGRKLLNHRYLYLMLLPGLLYFVVYRYAPMFGLVISFKDYYPALGFSGSEWVGLKHFRKLFTYPEFWRILRNTLIISLQKLMFAFPVPVLLAILLNELRHRPYKRVVQTISYLPHFLSWVVFGEIMKLVLSAAGPVNLTLQEFGLDKVMFMIDTGIFRGVLVGTTILKDSGWGTIIYLAAISSIDPQLYEAAFMDGANRFRRIWHITIPCISNVIVILLILRIGHIMDVGFHQILVLYNPAVYSVADIIDTYVYRVGVIQGNYSFTTAVGLFKGVVGLGMVYGANRLSKTFGEGGIW